MQSTSANVGDPIFGEADGGVIDQLLPKIT
jgi:hypothetical protein